MKKATDLQNKTGEVYLVGQDKKVLILSKDLRMEVDTIKKVVGFSNGNIRYI